MDSPGCHRRDHSGKDRPVFLPLPELNIEVPAGAFYWDQPFHPARIIRKPHCRSAARAPSLLPPPGDHNRSGSAWKNSQQRAVEHEQQPQRPAADKVAQPAEEIVVVNHAARDVAFHEREFVRGERVLVRRSIGPDRQQPAQ